MSAICLAYAFFQVCLNASTCQFETIFFLFRVLRQQSNQQNAFYGTIGEQWPCILRLRARLLHDALSLPCPTAPFVTYLTIIAVLDLYYKIYIFAFSKNLNPAGSSSSFFPTAINAMNADVCKISTLSIWRPRVNRKSGINTIWNNRHELGSMFWCGHCETWVANPSVIRCRFM